MRRREATKRRMQSTSKLLLLGVLLASALGGVRVAPALEVGEEAPDFMLPSTLGEEISLHQFREKQPVLIEFYGGDVPVCRANLATRKTDYRQFQALNIQVLGISVNNPFAQKLLSDSLQLPYPLLSDIDLKVAKAYGAVYGSTGAKVESPNFVGQGAGRAFFLVDKHGVVRGKWIGEDSSVFPSEMLLKGAQQMAEKP
jgi:peroxiredoxin